MAVDDPAQALLWWLGFFQWERFDEQVRGLNLDRRSGGYCRTVSDADFIDT